MNPVLILTHNCLDMTKRCVESVRNQQIDTVAEIIDNGSTDGTVAWVTEHGLLLDSARFNAGVSTGWNCGLAAMFGRQTTNHVLVINNDVILPPWFYGELLSYDVPFVSGVSVNKMEEIRELRPRAPLVGHPDFSAFLIRRDAWEAIGPFDEGMKFYVQDCDYHVRASQARMPLLAANLPFYHERSSTLRLASPEARRAIELQADRDRDYFCRKWGYPVGSQEYQRATGSQAGQKVPFPGERDRFS